MKRLILIVLMVGALSGCVSADRAASYNNLDLVRCSVSGSSPMGLDDSINGACSQELERRLKAGTITQQEIAIGNSAGAALGNQIAAGEPREVLLSRW